MIRRQTIDAWHLKAELVEPPSLVDRCRRPCEAYNECDSRELHECLKELVNLEDNLDAANLVEKGQASK